MSEEYATPMIPDQVIVDDEKAKSAKTIAITVYALQAASFF